jgi:endonuclease/exonuclease/phosphatase family metal-dependent hydrolase
MKWLSFKRWPLVGRIGNGPVRGLLGSLILVLAICLTWFVVNRALSRLNAARIETITAAGDSAKEFNGRLRVVTYNIAHGRGLADHNWQAGDKQTHLNRLDEIAAVLRDAGADIVILNEADFDAVWTSGVNQAHYIAEKAGFRFVAEQRNYDMAIPFFALRWGNAILSRRPIVSARCINFAPFATWERIVAGHKKGLLCEIRLDEDSVIRVFGVHLDTRSEVTRIQGAEMIESIRGESKSPLILAGDMNTGPLGFPRVFPAPDGRTAMSCLLATGAYRTDPLKAPTPADFTFRASNPSRVIDWILVSHDWEIISRSVIGGTLSDHKAVLMEMQLHSKQP